MMTRYDWTCGELPPAEIRDATGRQWTRMLWIDTETGEGERLSDILTGRLPTPEPVQLAPPVTVEFRP